MRPRFVVLLVFLTIGLVPATSATTVTPAQASCAGPVLDLGRPARLPRTGEVTVTGRFFVDGCNDVGVCHGVLGCQSCDYGPPVKPLTDLTIQLHQRGRTWDLATADATGDSGRVSWTFRLPPAARRGAATLTVDGAYADATPVRIG